MRMSSRCWPSDGGERGTGARALAAAARAEHLAAVVAQGARVRWRHGGRLRSRRTAAVDFCACGSPGGFL